MWREDSEKPLRDSLMICSFGFTCCSRHNCRKDLAVQYSLTGNTVCQSFYMDDCLSGADTVNSAVEMLKELFEREAFKEAKEAKEVEVE